MPSERVYFPEDGRRLATVGRGVLGLMFFGAGVGLIIDATVGLPFTPPSQDWSPIASVLVGLAFAAAGIVMWLRSDVAVVDPPRNRVKAWREPASTFPSQFALSDFDAVRIEPLVLEDEPKQQVLGYTLWLTGPETRAFLQAFEHHEEARQTAERTAAALGLPLGDSNDVIEEPFAAKTD